MRRASPLLGSMGALAVCRQTDVAYQCQGRACCTMSVNGATDAEKQALGLFAADLNQLIAASH